MIGLRSDKNIGIGIFGTEHFLAQLGEESALSTNDILLKLSSGRQLMVLLQEQYVNKGCLEVSTVQKRIY